MIDSRTDNPTLYQILLSESLNRNRNVFEIGNVYMLVYMLGSIGICIFIWVHPFSMDIFSFVLGFNKLGFCNIFSFCFILYYYNFEYWPCVSSNLHVYKVKSKE